MSTSTGTTTPPVRIAPALTLSQLLAPYRGSLSFAVATCRASWATSARVREAAGR